MTPDTSAHARPVPAAALLPFTLITFALSWGILGLYIFFPEPASRWFGEITGKHPAFVLAVWAPAFAAFAVVLYFGGIRGARAFLSRLRLWRCSVGWVLFLLLGIPLVFAAGAAVKGSLFSIPLPFDSVGAALGAMLFMLFLGPVEEFGWRGVALPILQRHMAPLWAGLIVGATWGLWHLPAFYLSGTVQSGWGFAPFFIGNVCLSLIVTPLFNASRGSILWPALFHFQVNNPLWPDAQPYDTWFFAGVAVLVVWINRRTMLARDGAVTEVFAPRTRARSSP
jgi:membrane protease YdiL (CAAX protease family)